jgi:hypothetical protein
MKSSDRDELIQIPGPRPETEREVTDDSRIHDTQA